MGRYRKLACGMQGILMRRYVSLFLCTVMIFTIALQPVQLVNAEESTVLWEESNETVTVYQNPDGTKTAVIEVEPSQLQADSFGAGTQSFDVVEDAFGLMSVTDDVITRVNDSFALGDEITRVEQGNLSISMEPVIYAPIAADAGEENTETGQAEEKQTADEEQTAGETQATGEEQTAGEEQAAGETQITDETQMPKDTEAAETDSLAVGLPETGQEPESSEAAAIKSTSELLPEVREEGGSPNTMEPAEEIVEAEQIEKNMLQVQAAASDHISEEEILSKVEGDNSSNKSEISPALPEEELTKEELTKDELPGDELPENNLSEVELAEEEGLKTENREIQTEIAPDKQTVMYENIFDEGIHIELRPIRNGIKEDIVLDEYTGMHVFSYRITVSGMYPKLSDNMIQFYDGSGTLVGEMPAPFMTDAADAYSEEIEVSLAPQGGGSYLVTYTVSETWLTDTSRVYPVNIDPTYTYQEISALVVDDVHVSTTSPNYNYDYRDFNLYCGNDGSSLYIPYIRLALPSQIEGCMIVDASLNMYEMTGNSGSIPYVMYQVTGPEWAGMTLTYNNAPALGNPIADSTKYINGGGWVNWNIKDMVSKWYHLFDQSGNYGVAIMPQDTGAVGTFRNFASSDSPWYRLYFSITYEDTTSPAPTLSAGGHELNSGTGYVDMSWSPVSNAEGYYVGVWNGASYQYIYVGNVTSWSTKGQKIWSTPGQIAAGEYSIRTPGSGAELPTIPADTYRNAGGDGNSVAYSFIVVPCNSYGQPLNPGKSTPASIVLPDRIAPNAPTAVTVNPSTYTNQNSIVVS